MFGSLGLPEILVILVLALLIFGPKRLPEVGRTIGKGLAEFRRATTDLKRSVNAELSLDDDERPPTTRRPVQGVGRTAAEASASRELPAAASADSAEGEQGAEAADAAKAAEARILGSGPASDPEPSQTEEPGPTKSSAAPPGTMPRTTESSTEEPAPAEPSESAEPAETASSTRSTHTG